MEDTRPYPLQSEQPWADYPLRPLQIGVYVTDFGETPIYSDQRRQFETDYHAHYW